MKSLLIIGSSLIMPISAASAVEALVQHDNASGYLAQQTMSLSSSLPDTQHATHLNKIKRDGRDVTQTLDASKSAVFAIYNRALRDHPELQGLMVLKLVIAPNGEVITSDIVSSELKNTELENKVLARIKLVRFPAMDVAPLNILYRIDLFNKDTDEATRMALDKKWREASETFEAEQQAEAERQAKEEEAHVLAERRRIDNHRQNEVNGIESIYGAGQVTEKNRVPWDSASVKSSRRSDDLTALFNEMNRELITADQEAEKPAPFQTPTKGEFEKTSDYEKRVSKARAKFDTEQAKISSDSRISASRSNVVAQFLGAAVINSTQYDADRETFVLNIGSSTSSFELKAEVKAPIADAERLKQRLYSARPRVMLDFTNGGFIARGAMVNIDDDWMFGAVVSQTKSPIVFGASALNTWNTKLAEQERTEAERQEKFAKADQMRRQERNKKYGHNGSYLKGGAFVCVSAKSAMRMTAIANSGNQFVSDSDDCIRLSNDLTPLSEAIPIEGDLAKVMVKGAQRGGYTSLSNIDF